MTLKNAKGVKLNITKVNGYEERWFTADDNNYITSDVGSILKTNSDIANLTNKDAMSTLEQINQVFDNKLTSAKEILSKK